MSEAQTIENAFQGGAVKHTVRQFIRFCVVGASSTAISGGIYFFLLSSAVHLDRILAGWLAQWPSAAEHAAQWHAHVPLAYLAGFVFGVTNGFIWNSRWTFPQSDPAARHRQAVTFLIVNIVGALLSSTIVWTVTMTLTHGRADGETAMVKGTAFVLATGITMFWNFTGSKYLAFKS
jgi:putative flippase GtrA